MKRNPVEAALSAIARELDDRGRAWALVGGLAVSARAEPRTTRDVDVVVDVEDDADAEALVRDLGSAGWQAVTLVEQEAVGRLATARLASPDRVASGTVVDLLFASSGIEREVAASAERLEILPGLSMRVATLGHLVALKVLARDDRRRPQDADDLRALLAEAGPPDVALARTALASIDTRGFGRGKRLVEELDALVTELAGSA
jgi:predicted nucleotidyltransferase